MGLAVAIPAVRRRRRWTKALVIGSAGLLGFSSWSVLSAGQSPDKAFGQDRDRVLHAAEQELAALDSMDSSRPDDGLRAWLDATTGALHDQLQRDAAQNRLKIQQAATTAVGSVTAAAVTTLDERTGTAQVIATVRIDLTPTNGQPSADGPSAEPRGATPSDVTQGGAEPDGVMAARGGLVVDGVGSTTEWRRYSVMLMRVGGGWKLSSLTAIPAGSA